MSQGSIEHVRKVVDATYRADSRCVLATQIHLLGDRGLAEDGIADAIRVALEQWASWRAGESARGSFQPDALWPLTKRAAARERSCTGD